MKKTIYSGGESRNYENINNFLDEDSDEESEEDFQKNYNTRKKKSKVFYYHNPQTPKYHYGPHHPMKPYRLALTFELVCSFGLDKHLNIINPPAATTAVLLLYHSEDYVQFIDKVCNLSSENGSEIDKKLKEKYNFVEDSPAFAGLGQYCRLYTGGSLAGARALCNGETCIAINWAGGLHHAKKREASGFCYINDIVTAIIELLTIYPRVLYIDIDVHHGDGVQDAFYGTDRVMTLSIHKHGDGFFPGTGDIDEIGAHGGKYFSVNVPLRSGIDDAGYSYIFEPVVTKVIETFNPSVIVMQCGADSLGCDRLGCFNLSIRGHGDCVRFVQSFNLPLLILGGGGYTIHNVSRCWTYETSILAKIPIPNDLPPNSYSHHFQPDNKLHPPVHLYNNEFSTSNVSSSSNPDYAVSSSNSSNLHSTHYSSNYHYISGDSLDNSNTRHYLDAVKATVLERIRRLQGAPSVQMQVIPRYTDFL